MISEKLSHFVEQCVKWVSAMWDNLALLALILTWLGHATAVIALAWLSRNKSYECRVLVTLYLLASVALLFPFEFDYFELSVQYTPSVMPILIYIVTDILMLSLVWYLFPVNTEHNKKTTAWSSNMQFGFNH